MKYQKNLDKPTRKRGRPRLSHNIAVQTDFELCETTFTNINLCDEAGSKVVRPMEITNQPTEDVESSKVTSTSIDVKTPPSSDGKAEGEDFSLQVPSPDLQDNVSSSLVPAVIESNSEKMSIESHFETVDQLSSSSSRTSPEPGFSQPSTSHLAIPPLRKTKRRFPTPMFPLGQLLIVQKPESLGQNNHRRLIGQSTFQRRQAGILGSPAPANFVEAGPSQDYPSKPRLQSGSPEKSKEEICCILEKPGIPASDSLQFTMDLDDILNEVTQGQGQSGKVMKIKRKGRLHGNVARDNTRCRTLRSNTKEAIGSKDKDHAQSLSKVSGDNGKEEIAIDKDKDYSDSSGKVSGDARHPDVLEQQQEANSMCVETRPTDGEQVNHSKGPDIEEAITNKRKSQRTREKHQGSQKLSGEMTYQMKKEAEKEQKKTEVKNVEKGLGRNKNQTGKEQRRNQAEKVSIQKCGILINSAVGTTSGIEQHSEREKKQIASKKAKVGGAVKVMKHKKGTSATPKELARISSTLRNVHEPTRMEISVGPTSANRPDGDSKMRKSVADQQSTNSSAKCASPPISVLSKMEGKSKEAISGKVVKTVTKAKRKSLGNSDMPVKKRQRFDKTVKGLGESLKQKKQPRIAAVTESTRKGQTDGTHNKHDLDSVGTPRTLKGTNHKALSEVSAGAGKFEKSLEGLAENGTRMRKEPRNAVKELKNLRNVEELCTHACRAEVDEQGLSSEQAALLVGPSGSITRECEQQYLQPGPSDHSQLEVSTNAATTCNTTTNLLKSGVRRKKKTIATIWCARRRRRKNALGTVNHEMFPYLDRKTLIRVQKLQNLLKNRSAKEVSGQNSASPAETHSVDALSRQDRSKGKSDKQPTEITLVKEGPKSSSNMEESAKLCKSYLEADMRGINCATTVIIGDLKGDSNEVASKLCLESISTTFDVNSSQECVEVTTMDEMYAPTSFKAAHTEREGGRGRPVLRRLLGAGVQARRILADDQSIDSSKGQSVEVCDGQSIDSSKGQSVEVCDGQSIDSSKGQSVEVCDGQSIDSSEGQSVEVCDGQSMEVSDGSQSADDQCVEVSDDGLSFAVSDDGQSAVISDDGRSADVSDDGRSADVSDDGQSAEVSDDGQSAVTSDNGQPVEVSGDGRSTEVSDDGQSVEVSDDGQSAEVSDDGQSAVISDDGWSAEVSDDQFMEVSDDQSADVSDGQSAEVSDGQSAEVSDDGQSVEVSDGQSMETNDDSLCGFSDLCNNGMSNFRESFNSGSSIASDMTNGCTSEVINSATSDGVDKLMNSVVKVDRTGRVDEITKSTSVYGQTSANIGRSKYTRTAKTTALTAIEKLGVHARPVKVSGLVKVSGESSSSQNISEVPTCQNNSISFEGNILEMSTQNCVPIKGIVWEADSSVPENLQCPASSQSNHSNQYVMDTLSNSDHSNQDSAQSSSDKDHGFPEDPESPSRTSDHSRQEGSGTVTPDGHQGPADLAQSDNGDQGQAESFKDSRSNTMRRYAKQKSSYWRGLGGWEDSLRPKPKKTQWFQIIPHQIKPHQSNRKDKQTVNKADVPAKPGGTSPQKTFCTITPKPKETADTSNMYSITPSTVPSKAIPLSTSPTPIEGQGSRGPTPTEGQGSRGSTPTEGQGSRCSDHADETDIGCLVWAKLGRDRWWPGLIVPGVMARMTSADLGSSWVYWFGDHKISQIASEKMVPFVYNFSRFFGKKTGKLYHSAVLEAIQVCVKRCGIDQSEDSTLQWAMDGFCIPQDTPMDQLTGPFDPIPGEELPQDVLENLKKIYSKVSECANIETKSRCRDTRDSALDIVKAGQKKIEDVCIACDDCDKTVYCTHPLFEGGLCKDCKDELTETLFCYGSDGTSVYCVICGFGGELFVCDNLNCGKAYCTECMELFLGETTVTKIRKASEWQCFLCTQYSSASHGCLHPHDDWQQRIIKLFDTGYRVTEPDLGYLSSDNKHQIRVLSLFDGIGTAKLILDKLNLDIGEYYSSEIDEDALLVSSVHHGSEVIQIGDVTKLDEEKLRSLCPIDLVIGGSPCNDFSLANPARKGFEFGGTGTLFFHFYRVLKSVQNFNVGRHLFWLYENVASMKIEYKKEMSAFLECGPALWDSKFFSPQTRARFFWGNIPGMYSTPELSQQYWSNFHLDTMLSPHCNRKATVNRIRTVTTRTNSLRQGKKEDLLPVMMNGKEDNIWISELERVFGFPPHYTDVGNLPPTKRQRLLGKSWSVPVVQHLLSPLAQYFAVKKETDTPTERKEGE